MLITPTCPAGGTIYHGDCLEVMRGWPDNFIDTIITDPPYGLSFMGKEWDHGVPGIPFWAEMLRVCKPGAMLLSFGGTRTFHRMTVAIEDAGWEIRDCITWLYGSGFPKSLDISKAIDKSKGIERKVLGLTENARPNRVGKETKLSGPQTIGGEITEPETELAMQWDGWGTALKPAWEPIIVAMKPLDGTFAQNAEKWGLAGLNVDGGRIKGSKPLRENTDGNEGSFGMGSRIAVGNSDQGRWPANLILDEEAAAMLDGQVGNLHPSANKLDSGNGSDKSYEASSYEISYAGRANRDYGNVGGGPSRFFYVAKADRTERNEGCDALQKQPSGVKNSSGRNLNGDYEERLSGNSHPTVKPLSLMKYLCNLTKTPTGGIVLDPFAGSGTTIWAAECHNRPWIGIEQNAEYIKIAEARIAKERVQIKMSL